MIIKCGKEAHIYSILLIIAFLLISISFTNSIEGGVLGFLILSPLMIACISSYEKVLIMDSKGCTVKLFCFSKTYKWSELKTKEYRYFKHGHAYHEIYESGAIFCKRRVRMSRRIKPSAYSFYFHAFRLFSFFYVYFPIDESLHYPGLYVVNEAEFRAKMGEWGVDMNDKTEEDKKYFPYR